MIQYYVLFKSECRSNATRFQMRGNIQMLLQMRWIKDNSALRWQAKTSTKPCKIHVKNSEDKKTDLEGNSRRMQSSRTTGRDGWIVSIYMLTGGEETRFLDASRPWWRWVRRGSIWQVNGHTRFCQEFFFYSRVQIFCSLKRWVRRWEKNSMVKHVAVPDVVYLYMDMSLLRGHAKWWMNCLAVSELQGYMGPMSM